jgi:uncharacterized phage protein (TIGR01671 family)
MREILFRGKRKDGGKWVYGYFAITDANSPSIYNGKKGLDKYGNHWASVDPGTVGQYTGLKDKDGAMIFEGDILQFQPPEEDIYKVVFNQGGWMLVPGGGSDCDEYLYEWHTTAKVTGNIYDNPERLADDWGARA